MPSRALREWRTTQRAELDRVDALLRGVHGAGPAERAMRRHLVDGGIVLLAGHFQRYCRDLYGETAEFLASQVQPAAASNIVRGLLMERPALSTGNAHSGSLAKDFGRFDFGVRSALTDLDRRNETRMRQLDQLNAWRNAIAHQQLQPGYARSPWRALTAIRAPCACGGTPAPRSRTILTQW